MAANVLELRLDVELEPDADAVEIEGAALNLREELLELDVDTVERPASGPPPEGAKGVEATLVGTLLVSAGKEVIGAVVRTLAGWVSRDKSRSVRLQLGGDIIDITNPSEEDQQRLLEAFLARHAEAR